MKQTDMKLTDWICIKYEEDGVPDIKLTENLIFVGLTNHLVPVIGTENQYTLMAETNDCLEQMKL